MPTDLISFLLTILSGAASVVVSRAAKDVISEIRDLIKRRYMSGAFDEENEKEVQRALELRLRTSGANSDEELLALTKRLAVLVNDAALLSEVSRVHTGEFDGPEDVGEKQSRTIDASLITERFEPGQTATLTVVIRHPHSRTSGKWQSEAQLDPSAGPVQILLEVQGFTVTSEPPAPIIVTPDRDTAPAAFELRIEEKSQRWVHILLMQEGRPVGELMINDFSAMGKGPTQESARSALRRVSEADLTLLIRAAEGRIEVCSPRDRASLDHVTITGFRYPATPFRELLASRLRALYDSASDPESTARELKLVGVELAGHLPQDLLTLLYRKDIRSIMLRHEDDFDFPLELVYLDSANDSFFVGDRIAVCRWYLGVRNLPDFVTKEVRKVAFLKGGDNAALADELLLKERFKNRTVTFDKKRDVIAKLFKTTEYDLIHFTGHCREKTNSMGGLELADGKFLRLIEIGQLEAERAFTKKNPFVMLNACASAQPYLGLTHYDSFAHRFVTSQACAMVGTLWPVDGKVANEFAQRFYAELATKPIGQALLDAKLGLVNAAGGVEEQSDRARSLRRLARQVAVRSYCIFANPDLRLVA